MHKKTRRLMDDAWRNSGATKISIPLRAGDKKVTFKAHDSESQYYSEIFG